MKLIIISLLAIITISTAFQDADIVSARIESCRGCSLNRLPEVKNFILNDAPKYERLQVNFISGAPPELILLGEGDAELERLALSSLSREQCNELLMSRGFKQTANKSDL